jgi:hypothetical protein
VRKTLVWRGDGKTAAAWKVRGIQATGRNTVSGGIVVQTYNNDATVGMEIQEIQPRIRSISTRTTD